MIAASTAKYLQVPAQNKSVWVLVYLLAVVLLTFVSVHLKEAGKNPKTRGQKWAVPTTFQFISIFFFSKGNNLKPTLADCFSQKGNGINSGSVERQSFVGVSLKWLHYKV